VRLLLLLQPTNASAAGSAAAGGGGAASSSTLLSLLLLLQFFYNYYSYFYDYCYYSLLTPLRLLSRQLSSAGGLHSVGTGMPWSVTAVPLRVVRWS